MKLFIQAPFDESSEETKLSILWKKIDCVFIIFDYLKLEEIYRFLLYIKYFTSLDLSRFKTYRFFSKILKKCKNIAYPINFPKEAERCPDVVEWIRKFKIEKELDLHSQIHLWNKVSRNHTDATKLFSYWTGVPMNSFFKIKRMIKQENEDSILPLKTYHQIRFVYLFSREAQHNFANNALVAFKPENSPHKTVVKIWGFSYDISLPNPTFFDLEESLNKVISSPKEKLLLLFHDVVEPTLNITFLFFERNEIHTGKINLTIGEETRRHNKIVSINEQSFLLENTFALTFDTGIIRIFRVALRGGKVFAEALKSLHPPSTENLYLPYKIIDTPLIFSDSNFFKQQTVFMRLGAEKCENSITYLSAVILQCGSDHYPHSAKVSLNSLKNENCELELHKSLFIRGGPEMALINLLFDKKRKTLLLLFLSDGDPTTIESYSLKCSKNRRCLDICPDFESKDPFRGDRVESPEVIRNKLSEKVSLNAKLSSLDRVFALEKMDLRVLNGDNFDFQGSRCQSRLEQQVLWNKKGLNKRINCRKSMQLVIFEIDLMNFKQFLDNDDEEKNEQELISYNLKFLYTFPSYSFRFSPVCKHSPNKKWIKRSSFLDPLRFSGNSRKLSFKEVHFLNPRIREGYLVINVEHKELFFPLVSFFTSLHYLTHEAHVHAAFNYYMSTYKTFSTDLTKMAVYKKSFRGKAAENQEIHIFESCECLAEMLVDEKNENVAVYK